MACRKCILTALGIYAATLGFIYFATPARSMGMCGLRADFLAALSDKYQETGKAIGLAGQVNLVEIFASKAGTWTIIVTAPEGKSCIIAAGTSWEDLPIKKLGDET